MEITLTMRFAVPPAYYFCAGGCPNRMPAEDLRWVEGIEGETFEKDHLDGYYCNTCVSMFRVFGSYKVKGPLLSEVLPEYPFTDEARADKTLARIKKWQEENPDAANHPVWEEITRHSVSEETEMLMFGVEYKWSKMEGTMYESYFGTSDDCLLRLKAYRKHTDDNKWHWRALDETYDWVWDYGDSYETLEEAQGVAVEWVRTHYTRERYDRWMDRLHIWEKPCITD